MCLIQWRSCRRPARLRHREGRRGWPAGPARQLNQEGTRAWLQHPRPAHATAAGGQRKAAARLGGPIREMEKSRPRPARVGLQAAGCTGKVSLFSLKFVSKTILIWVLNSNQTKLKPHLKINQMQQHECIIKYSTYYFKFYPLKYYLNHLNS
jgi:hypothetical protein